MRLDEIILDPKLTTFESLQNAIAIRVSNTYQEIETVSQRFAIPAQKVFPRDTIYELLEGFESDLATVTTLRMPQTVQSLRELIGYLTS